VKEIKCNYKLIWSLFLPQYSALRVKDCMSYLKKMNGQIKDWKAKNNFKYIDDFRGKLKWQNYAKPAVFVRSRFMKYPSSVD
jgi:hypothetical protein